MRQQRIFEQVPRLVILPSVDDFARQREKYEHRGLSKTAGRYADLSTVLEDNVSDEKFGLFTSQLNELSDNNSRNDVGIDDVQKATEAVIEKSLTQHVGEDLSISLDLSSPTVSDITTRLFNDGAIASNIDLLVAGFEDSASQGLLSLLNKYQLMTPLCLHQRDVHEKWRENSRSLT